MNEQTKVKIELMIKSSKIFLFMKGTPHEPLCGFSKRTVDTLTSLKVKFCYFDVLSDEEIRQGIKDYAHWPTIPQLYINGEFIGGCDITEQLAKTGELQRLVS